MEAHKVKGPKASWAIVPEELKIQILENLVPDPLDLSAARHSLAEQHLIEFPDRARLYAGRRDLLAASKTSHELRRLSVQLMYEDVVLENENQLFTFFRTLVCYPERRAWIRNFAWLGRLGLELSLDADFGRQLQWFTDGQYAQAETPEDTILFQHLQLNRTKIGFEDDERWCWKILAAVLGMMPRLKSLTVSHIDSRTKFERGAHDWASIETDDIVEAAYDACQEYTAIRHLLSLAVVPAEHIPNVQMMPYISGRQFKQFTRQLDAKYRTPCYLQELESINFIPLLSAARSSRTRPTSMQYLLLNCPAVRKVDISGSFKIGAVTRLRGHSTPFGTLKIWQKLPPVRAVAVEELTLRHWDLQVNQDWARDVPQLFPNLRKLSIDVDDCPTEWDWAVVEHDNFARDLSRLSSTLECLSITGRNSHKRSDDDLNAQDGCVATVLDGALYVALPHLTCLTHLTVDCSFLFGSTNTDKATSIGLVLPPSVVHFHLIDYWGMNPTQALTNADMTGNPACTFYYPEAMMEVGKHEGLPDHAEFFGKLFEGLAEHFEHRLQALRSVTFSTPFYDVEGDWAGLCDMYFGREPWASAVADLFEKKGVQFFATSMLTLSQRCDALGHEPLVDCWDADLDAWKWRP